MPTDDAVLPESVTARLARVRLLAMDVDGVLTDGGVYFDDAGREMRRFQIQDGLGIVLARLAGLSIAWITGRNSPLVERRARELKVEILRQGVRDKAAALASIAQELNLAPEAVAFLGDDLNDLPALQWAGVALAPANAAPDVRNVAHYVTPRSGGQGAARDAIEAILHARGDWDTTLRAYLASLSEPSASNPVQ